MNAIITKKTNRFLKHVRDGIEEWTKAGKLLVDLVDENPNAYDDILEAADGQITRAHLAKFEAIGRGGLEPRLLLNGSVGYAKLQNVPLSEQQKALRDGVKLYEPTSDGNITHRIVRPEDLNPFEASQVFAPGGSIRTPEEQASYLRKRESRKNADAAPATKAGPSYRIIKGKLVVTNACTLTPTEVSSILQEMLKRAAK